MPKVKPQYLHPQRSVGHHGSIAGQSTEKLTKHQIVIVYGLKGDRLLVRPASSGRKSQHSGFLSVVDHDSPPDAPVRCVSYSVVEMDNPRGRVGDPVYLNREGGWTLIEPKVGKKQVGTVIALEQGKGVLLAPNLAYT